MNVRVPAHRDSTPECVAAPRPRWGKLPQAPGSVRPAAITEASDGRSPIETIAPFGWTLIPPTGVLDDLLPAVVEVGHASVEAQLQLVDHDLGRTGSRVRSRRSTVEPGA